MSDRSTPRGRRETSRLPLERPATGYDGERPRRWVGGRLVDAIAWWRRGETGEVGEAAAAEYLAAAGWAVLARNHAIGPGGQRGELDLVVRKDDVVAIVEVRTRTAGAAVRGVQSVDRAKQARLVRAAEAYLRDAPAAVRACGVRFDVVSVAVDRDGRVTSVEHVPRAFEPDRLAGRGAGRPGEGGAPQRSAQPGRGSRRRRGRGR